MDKTKIEDGTLRDYLAGQAIIGLLMSEDHFQTNYEAYAKNAYRIADAMIKVKDEVTT